MLTVVLAVAVVGIALLAAAVVTDNTFIALAAIALAVVGLFLLARDWLADRRRHESPPETHAEANDVAEPEHVPEGEPLEPDEFKPDVPYEESDAPQEAVDDEQGSIPT
ncbi:hypothetical protein [Mycobacterium sp.]|uniref:hypothetical protein n=1 Tax=Mycobacterium sp. TaxID=1785 RepID=UPI003C722ACB